MSTRKNGNNGSQIEAFQTTGISPPNETKVELSVMPLNKIKTTRSHLRLGIDTNMDELVESIKNQGLIHPLVVTSDGELVAGGRRYTALKALGHAAVRVSVVAETNDAQLEMLAIDENLRREDLDDVARDAAMKRRKELYEQRFPNTVQGKGRVKNKTKKVRSFAEDTGKKTGLSKRTIQKSVARARLSSPVIEAREKGELKPSQADELTRLQPEEQVKALPLVKDKTVRETKKIIESLMISEHDNQSHERNATARQALVKETKTKIKHLVTHLESILAANKCQEMCSEIKTEVTKLENVLRRLRVDSKKGVSDE